MRRLGKALLIVIGLAAAATLCSCALGPGGSVGVLYESASGRFEIRVPSTWDAEELDSLLTGVVFRDSSAGGSSVRLWVLYGVASGRTPVERLGDLQSIRALFLDPSEGIEDWNATPASPRTLGGMSGSGLDCSFILSGIPTQGLVAACSSDAMDYLLIAEVAMAAFGDFKSAFESAFDSFDTSE